MIIKIDNGININDLSEYKDIEIIGFLSILILNKDKKIDEKFLLNYYIDYEKLKFLLKKLKIFSESIEIVQKNQNILITKKAIINEKIVDIFGIIGELPTENQIEYLFYNQKKMRKNIKLNNDLYYKYKVINDYEIDLSKTDIKKLINLFNKTNLKREQIIFCLDYTLEKSYTNNLNFEYLEKMIDSVEKLKDNSIEYLNTHFYKKRKYKEPVWNEKQMFLSAEEKKLVEEYINE